MVLVVLTARPRENVDETPRCLFKTDRRVYARTSREGRAAGKQTESQDDPPLCGGVCCFPIRYAPQRHGDPILGSNMSTFAILGGAGVTIACTGSVITGSVGAYPTTSITGVIPTNFSISGGTVQAGGATAQAGQSELGTAITALEGMSGGATPITGAILGGLTLGPGVYSASSTMGLTGTLNLDGGGNANALWVFLVSSA